MKRAQAGFARLQRGATKLGGGLNMIGDGMRNAGLAMLPVTAGLGFGAKKAADFEKQMSAVGAITRASADDLAALTNEAKRQGVVSVFSAQQSAEAMEFLGRAGFGTTDVIKSLGGVMAAAAADGISLATSSDIVARTVKGMGLEVEQAAHVADVLALTSAKTNTNIIALGEAMTYGAPQAKALGVSLEETTAAFGLMADAGLRGSIGGTSFMNMLVKLSKPSTKAAGYIKKFGIKLTDAHGALKPLPDIIGMFKTELDKVNDVTQKSAMIAEIFGLRGAKAYSALSLAGRQKMAELTEDLEASSFGLGAAQEMANKRLDNFLGALTLFGSSLEATAIEFFGPFLNAFKEVTQDITNALNGVLFAVQALKQIREQAGLSAVKAAKRETRAIVEQQGALANLTRREQANAKAGIAAIQTRLIGQEKLTREQQRARSRSFAEFVRGNLAREKLTKRERMAQMRAIDQFIEDNDKGNLSTEQRIKMEERYLQTLVTIGKKGKKLDQEAAKNEAKRLERLIKRRATVAQFEAAAEAAILREEKLAEVEREHGRAARLIAEGVLRAIDEIKTGFKVAIQAVKDFGQRFGEAVGERRLANFARIATIGVVVAGALAPVFLGLTAFSFLIKSMVLPQVIGLFKVLASIKPILFGVVAMVKGVIAGAFLPLTIAIGIAGAAFLLLRRRGESVGDTLSRLWASVRAFGESLIWWRKEGESATETITRGFELLGIKAQAVWGDYIKPFLIDSWDLVKAAFSSVVNFVSGVWGQIGQALSEVDALERIKASAYAVWAAIKTVAGAVGDAISAVVEGVKTAVWPFISGFVSGWVSALGPIVHAFSAVWSAVATVFGEVWGVIKTIGQEFSALWTEIIDLFVDDVDRSSAKWSGLGETIGTVAGWLVTMFVDLVGVVVRVAKTIIQGVAALVKGLVQLFGWFAKTVMPVVLLPFKMAWQGISNFASGVISLFQGDFTEGMRKIFLSLVDIVLAPFRMIIKAIVQLTKTAPGLMGKLVPADTLKKLDTFAKYGFSGKPKPAPTPKPQSNVIDLAAARRQRELGLDLPAPRLQMPAMPITGARPGDPAVARIQALGGIKSDKQAARIAEMLAQTNKDINAKNIEAAKRALGVVSERRRKEARDRAKAADKELKANVNLEDKRTVDVTAKMCVDGEAANLATGRAKKNFFERNGATHEPYLNKIATETGVRMAGNSRT